MSHLRGRRAGVLVAACYYLPPFDRGRDLKCPSIRDRRNEKISTSSGARTLLTAPEVLCLGCCGPVMGGSTSLAPSCLAELKTQDTCPRLPCVWARKQSGLAKGPLTLQPS